MRASSLYAVESLNSCLESKEREGIWDVEAQNTGSIRILKSVSSMCKKKNMKKTNGFCPSCSSGWKCVVCLMRQHLSCFITLNLASKIQAQL